MMASGNKNERLVWQHPFVNIFKQFKVDDWKKSSKEGDVSSIVDKHIKSTVYKIQGSVPAGNYIQFPQTTTQSLGLTGRFLYILFKPIPTKYFVVHIDTVVDDGLVVRISFSNLFKEFKSTATWLQFPFACHAAKGSVEHFASLGARQDFMGPAPLAQKWTMLVLDLHYILSIYMNRKYSYMKNIRLCANILVKNCFTSDICYDPRLSVRQARIVGIKSVDENYAPMPRELNFFLAKDKQWDDMYDVVRFPLESPQSSQQHLPYDSIQRVDESPQILYLKNKNQRKSSTMKNTMGVIKSPRRDKSKVVDVTRNQSVFSSTNNMAVSTRAPEDGVKKKPKVVPELPPVGLSLVETHDASCSDHDATVVETSSGEVHVFAGESSPDREIVVHRHFSGESTGKPSIATINMRTNQTTFTSKGNSSTRSFHSKSDLALRKPSEDTTYLQPTPILKLSRIIGFGSGAGNDIPSLSYQGLALWHPNPSFTAGSNVVVYAVHAVVVAIDTESCRQQFFIGHTGAVTSVAFNNPRGNSPCILASSQRGSGGIVRIWRYETQKCAAIIRSQQAHGMKALALSTTGGVLVGIGRDGHGKTLFMVWDTSSSLRSGSVSVIAKANTEVEITRIHVCPTDDSRMVTCGRDNIRFWRVRSNQLRSCPAVIPTEQKLEEITDIKFAPTGMISAKNRPSESDKRDGMSVFACTKAGFVFEIDYQKVNTLNVHKLYPASSSSSKATKGLQLNSLYFSGSYLATGSDDGVLRLWPLDLSAVFLEVEHEGPIKDIAVTRDGAKVLVVTNVGTLGFLDVSTRKYSTLMRSHTDTIKDGCMDGLRRTLSTCSEDRTIRVWDIDTMRQLYDFATPDDPPTVVCCHPLLEIFACGFASGAVRIFHVSSTSILSENTPTNVKITCLIFAMAGQRLIAADEKGNLVLYDTSDIEHVGAPILRTLLKVACCGDQWGPRAVVASPDDRRVAFVGPNEFTVTLAACATLDELLRIDVSTGFKMEPDILNQRPKIDAPVRLAFSSAKLNQLLILTRACRLLKLDAKSGQLLSITEHVHRSKPTAITACDDDKHLVTAGDKIIRVWDYQMSKDINFQAFIGHSSPVHNLLITPDRLKVISVADDAIFMWNLLGADETPSDQFLTSDDMVVIGRGDGRSTRKALTTEEISDGMDGCPQPDHPPTPHRSAKHQSWVPPETLHTSDLDASNVSEFTVDAKMMERLARTPSKKQGATMPKTIADEGEETTEKLRGLALRDCSVKLPASEPSDVPVKVAWNSKSKLDLSSIVPPSPRRPPPLPAQRPGALCHYSSIVSTSQPPPRTYAAPQGEEGMTLQAVIGYNGNGRGNLIWSPDIGLLAYTCGAIVTLERLAEGKKYYLRGHTEEISCLAMQYDGRIIASASASNGLVQSKICLWDTTTLLCRATLKHHDYDVIDLSFSRDDRFMVSLGDYRECSVVVWSAFNGVSSPMVVASAKTVSPMHRISWDPHTANKFATVGTEASICFWLLDEEPGAHKVTLNFHDTDIPDDIKKDETNRRLVDFTSACYADDNVLFIGSSAGLVSAWDTVTNTCYLHWKADSAEIIYMKAQGDRLVVAGASRGVRLWSLVGTKEARCYGNSINFVMDDELSLNAPIISGAFDDTLDMGIVGTVLGDLWYLDWTNRSTVRMVSGHSGKITDIAFDEGPHFATSCDGGTVRLWDSSSFQLTVQFQVIDFACYCVAFSHPPGSASMSSLTQPKMLAAGYQDGTLRVFDLDKLILKLKLQPHSSGVSSVGFASDNNTLLSGAGDGTVAATSLATGVTLRVLKDHRGANINSILCSLRQDHPASLFVRDELSDDDHPGLMLICGGDRRVSVWDTDWQHDVCNMIDWLTFPAPCFAPDGSKLPKDDKESMKSLPPSVCIFHPTNSDLLLYCGYGMDKSVQHYSLTQRKVVKSTTVPNWATTMGVSPQGSLFAIGTDTRIVELVDAQHGTFQDYTGHSSEVKKLIFSPDGQLLLSSAGCELLVWKIKDRCA